MVRQAKMSLACLVDTDAWQPRLASGERGRQNGASLPLATCHAIPPGRGGFLSEGNVDFSPERSAWLINRRICGVTKAAVTRQVQMFAVGFIKQVIDPGAHLH